MKRRNFIKCCSIAVPGAVFANSLGSNIVTSHGNSVPKHRTYEDDYIKKVADTVLFTAKNSGAQYSDFRLSNFRSQNVSTREQVIQNVSDNENFGFAVRVIIEGTWGFAASSTFSEDEAVRITKIACETARANNRIQKNRVELVPTPVYERKMENSYQKKRIRCIDR